MRWFDFPIIDCHTPPLLVGFALSTRIDFAKYFNLPQCHIVYWEWGKPTRQFVLRLQFLSAMGNKKNILQAQ